MIGLAKVESTPGGNATPTSDGGPIDEPGRDERSSASPRFRFSRPASRSKGKTIWVDPIEKVRRPSNAGLRVLRMGRPIAACPAAALALLRERKTLLIDLAPSQQLYLVSWTTARSIATWTRRSPIRRASSLES